MTFRMEHSEASDFDQVRGKRRMLGPTARLA